jgi:hypothetical protein
MYETISHPHKRAFLAAFAELGNVKRAATVAGISREAHYDWRRNDAEYAAAFEDATARAGDALEDEAMRRARFGVAEYVVSKGEIVMLPAKEGEPRKPLMKRRYSDALLTLLLKGAKPQKYRERFEHSGPDGGPIELAVDYSKLSDEELSTLERLAEKATTEPEGAGG